MNTSKTNKHFFRKFLILILALSLVLSIFLFAGCNNTPDNDDDEDNTNTEETVVDKGYIKNGTFEFLYNESTTDTDYPRNPKNWSFTADGSGDDKAPSKDTDVIQGVMDISDDLFEANKDKFANGEFSENPGKATSTDKDSKLLMINNKTATAGSFTSTSISLPSKSYVVISAKIQTHVSDKDAGAHISIIDGLEENVIVRNINTDAKWLDYKIYMETSSISTKSIKLQLGLGRGDRLNSYGHVQGCVYFDNVELNFISQAEYLDGISGSLPFRANGETDNDIIVDHKEVGDSISYSFVKTDINDKNQNFDFDTNIPEFEANAAEGCIVDVVDANQEEYTELLKVKDKNNNYLDLPFTPNSTDQMLMLKNSVKATSSASIENVISVEQNNYYLLSFYVKTSEMIKGTGLNVNLYRMVNGKKSYTNLPSFTTIDTTQNNIDLLAEENVNNKLQNWQQYSFLIAGNGFNTQELGIEFTLGKNLIDINDITTSGNVTNDAKGSAFINNINIEKISKSEFDAASTGSQTKKLSLSKLSDSGINNGNFNTPNSNNFNFNEELYNNLVSAKDFAVLPQGHQNVGGTGITVPHDANAFAAGIVNNNSLSALIGKGLAEESVTEVFDATNTWGAPNAFMIYNKQATSIGLISSTFNLNTDKVYLISVRVRATDSASYSIYLVDNDTNKVVTDENGNKVQFTNKGAGQSTTFDDMDIIGNNWSEYTFFVRTKDISKNYKLEVWNGSRSADEEGSQNSTGSIFIDDITLVDFNAESFDDNKVKYTDSAYVNKDRILFADYKEMDVIEDEEEETTTDEEETEQPASFNWTLFSVAMSSALLIIAFVVVLIVRTKKKGFFAKKKEKTTQNYTSEKIDASEEDNNNIEE